MQMKDVVTKQSNGESLLPTFIQFHAYDNVREATLAILMGDLKKCSKSVTLCDIMTMLTIQLITSVNHYMKG